MKRVIQHILGAACLFVYLFLLIGTQTSVAQVSRTWQFKAPMPTARTGVSAVVLNDKIYVMGGLDAQGNILDVVEQYDPTSNTWQTSPNLRTARYNAAAVVHNGNIFLMGGQDSSGSALKKVEIFIPSESDWSSFDNLNEEREGLAAVVLNNELYVMGGSNGSANILDSVEFLDNTEEKWENSTTWTLDVPRALFSYVTIDSFAYSIGGFSSFGPIGLVQRYNENDGTLDLAPLMPGRGGLSAVVLDNSIYAIGGRQSNNQVVNTVNRFFPDQNLWEQAPALKTGRERFAAVLFNDQIFVFGGNTDDGDVLNSTETFAISIVPNPTDDVLVTDEDAEMSINVLVNDNDPAGGALSISSFSQPSHGTVTQVNTSTFNYAPSKDYFGEDQFTYTALNLTGGTAQATVNVTVHPLNDAPVFSSAPVTGGAQNTLYSYTLSAIDVDNDPLTFQGLEVPDWLMLTDMQNGEALLEGMPNAEHEGEHTVIIAVTDGTELIEQKFTITIVEGAPGTVMLISPADGAQDLPRSLTLSWNVPGAATYDLEISLDMSFTSVVFEESGLTQAMFELNNLEDNTQYFWRVRGVNAVGSNTWAIPFEFHTAMDTASEEELPTKSFTLYSNYPNPFRDATWIEFELTTAASSSVQLDIYDLRGRQVVILETGYMSPGRHSVRWNGSDAVGRPVASGSYLVRLQHGSEQHTRLIVLIR